MHNFLMLNLAVQQITTGLSRTPGNVRGIVMGLSRSTCSTFE